MSTLDTGQDSTDLSLFGTVESPQVLRSVQLGSLSFLYAQDAIRRICWNGTELVRAIAWPMRDENWGTYPAELKDEQITQDDDGFSARVSFAVGDGRLECDLTLEASADGEVQASITMSPRGGPFATNRSGFTVLHPIRGVAGGALGVTHSDGSTEDTVFPELVSPDQPVMDIAQLRYDVGPASVDIVFEGEVFEMEDQRNWSDASYKTYCVPLVFPFRYEIAQPVTQTIRISCSGDGTGSGAGAKAVLSVTPTDQPAPNVGLAVEGGWIDGAASREAVVAAGARHLLVRSGAGDDEGYLTDCAALAAALQAEVDAEIVLADDIEPAAGLTAASERLTHAGLAPKRVLALRAGYLGSHQPSGPWPEGPVPAEVCVAARAAFPDVAIGGGMMTNFTELNRCRPDPATCDYIAHGNTAIVHAGDDMSVLETLEALPQNFASAQAMAGGHPYRLGLVSIGMRSNPYGAAVAENPTQIRRTMAREDPRQRGLFAAAWAVGVLAASEGRGVEALCLAAPAGPFGIVYEPQDYPQAGYDGTQAQVYPLYHVVRAACAMSGAPRLAIDGALPDGVAAFGVMQQGGPAMMVANVSDEPKSVTLAQPASVALLDTHSFGAATAAHDWLDTADRRSCTQLELGPFATAFAGWGT